MTGQECWHLQCGHPQTTAKASAFAGTSEELLKAAGHGEPAEVSGPAQMRTENEDSATPEHPDDAVERPAAAAEAAPQAEPEAAMEEDTLSEKPQEAAHADADTAMQDADVAVDDKSAQVAADTEMADVHAHMSAQEDTPSPDQAMQQAPGDSRAPEAATEGPAPLLRPDSNATGSDKSSSITGELSAKSGPAIASVGHSGMTQTAQARSASAGSVHISAADVPSITLTEQKATQMHSPAAGILSKASVSACTATAAVQPAADAVHSAAEADPSTATDTQTQPNQTPIAAAELPNVAPTSLSLATDRPVAFPDLSNQQQQQQVQVQMPSTEAPSHTQQTQPEVEVPKPPVAAAAAPKMAAPAFPAARNGQPGHSGLQLGSSAMTPPLRAGIFGSPIPATPVKAWLQTELQRLSV